MKMSIIERLGQINTNRFVYGLLILFGALIARKLYKHLSEAKSKRDVIATLVFSLPVLVGTAFIITSIFPNGQGVGFGKEHGIELTSTEESSQSEVLSYSVSLPVEISVEDALSQIENQESFTIRIYGDLIYLNSYQCQSINELAQMVKYYYSDSANVVLIDDFAEDAVFEHVLGMLKECGIAKYQIVESEKE